MVDSLILIEGLYKKKAFEICIWVKLAEETGSHVASCHTWSPCTWILVVSIAENAVPLVTLECFLLPDRWSFIVALAARTLVWRLSRVVSPTAVRFCWLPQPFPGPHHCVSPFVRSTQPHILLWEDSKNLCWKNVYLIQRASSLSCGQGAEPLPFLRKAQHSQGVCSASHSRCAVQWH